MSEKEIKISVEGNIIKVAGSLDGAGAEKIATAMNTDVIYSLDFGEVDHLNFAAIRALLRCRQKGQHFCIINATDAVAERMEDTGVSTLINVCRKPKKLDLSKYTEVGASFLSHAYNSEDGDSMIKVYGARVPKWMVAQEKAVAKAVMMFGIPTPLVGTLYEDGESTALDFERIEGKRSFSRIISEEPERLEEMTVRFARMCKKLHSTKCDTNMFSDRTVFYRQAVANAEFLTPEEKAKAMKFIDSIPAAETCLHGDMQLSNVITTEKEDMWIDLSDFGYGNPMLDMGMWYFQARLNDERIMKNLFHFGQDTMDRIWPVFVKEYFGADTPAKQEEVNRSIEPYAALHMLYLGASYGFEGNMLDYVRKQIL